MKFLYSLAAALAAQALPAVAIVAWAPQALVVVLTVAVVLSICAAVMHTRN